MAIVSNEQVAAKVRGVAAERRATQADLAEALHMSAMAMSRRFSGNVPFTGEDLSRIADVLGTTVGVFFGEHQRVVSERAA